MSDFLLHQSRFHRGLATSTSAFLSTGVPSRPTDGSQRCVLDIGRIHIAVVFPATLGHAHARIDSSIFSCRPGQRIVRHHALDVQVLNTEDAESSGQVRGRFMQKVLTDMGDPGVEFRQFPGGLTPVIAGLFV